MKKIMLAKATASLADFARALQGEMLVLTQAGRPVAALVPIQGMDLESLAVGTSPAFLDIIQRSRHRYEQEGGISLEQVRARLGVPAITKGKARNGRPLTPRKPTKRASS